MPSRSNHLLLRFQSVIADNPQWAPDGTSIGIAVSGGPDSVALADLLTQLAPEHGWNLTFLHYNHCLRGDDSDQDQEFVCAFARKTGIPAVIESAHPTTEFSASATGMPDTTSSLVNVQGSMEMIARARRHDFLARKAVELGLSQIALAHHQDDQQELFWIRLLRGSSMEGLGGMHSISASPSNPKIKLWRPLLEFSRQEILDYLQWRKLEFREDKTNQELDPLRNRVRLEMIPWLQEKMQPGIRTVVDRWMNQAREIHKDLEQWRARCIDDQIDFQSWPRSVQKLHVAKQLPALGRKPEERIITWLIENPGKWMSLDPERSVRLEPEGKLKCLFENQIDRNRSGETMSSNNAEKIEMSDLDLDLDLTCGGALQLGKIELRWEIDALNGAEIAWQQKRENEEWFDADKLGSRCRLRRLQPGDTYFPIGSFGPLKLKKYLAGLGFGAQERRQTLLAETENGSIFWISRGRISELFKLDKTASRRLKWTFMRR